MKIILFASMSVNGMIADKNGQEDFLSDTSWKYFVKTVEEHDCLIVGRKAYEAVQKYSDYNFNDIKTKLKIVISSNNNFQPDSSFVFAKSPEDAIEKATAMNIDNAVLAGGSMTNSAFIINNLIDEVVLIVEPVFIGGGIPVFATKEFEKRLSLTNSQKVDNDILMIKYKILK
ncbi:MAG: dihydrofolate reductase family protein [Patescibacteria group bacterium]|jgi:dihydrofolate reductase